MDEFDKIWRKIIKYYLKKTIRYHWRKMSWVVSIILYGTAEFVTCLLLQMHRLLLIVKNQCQYHPNLSTIHRKHHFSLLKNHGHFTKALNSKSPANPEYPTTHSPQKQKKNRFPSRFTFRINPLSAVTFHNAPSLSCSRNASVTHAHATDDHRVHHSVDHLYESNKKKNVQTRCALPRCAQMLNHARWLWFRGP